MRLKVTRTQIAVEALRHGYFLNNPGALPGTKVTKGMGKSSNVELTASPEQLAAFLQLHGDTKEVYTEMLAIYNRVGT